MPSIRPTTFLSSIAIVMSAAANPAISQELNVEWLELFKTNVSPSGSHVAFDGANHTYIAGETLLNLSGTPTSNRNIFIAKYDSLGNQAWITQYGGGATERLGSIDVDGAGNTYVTGETTNSLFVAKYDTTGGMLWNTTFGSSQTDFSTGVAINDLGEAYVTGTTFADLGGTSAGSNDSFLAKFDASGGVDWIQQFGTASTDESKSVDLDSEGNIYITGATFGSLESPNATGYEDTFLLKYDASGNKLWGKQLGSSPASSGGLARDNSESVAIDSGGNAYITGWTTGSLDGPAAGRNDAFLIKYDSEGNLLWTKQLGTAIDEIAWDVAVDNLGNPYISGKTNDSTPPGQSSSDDDIFIAKYDVLGNLLWFEDIQTPSGGEGHSLVIDNNGNIYLAGDTSGIFGTDEILGANAFLAKFSVPEPSSLALFGIAGMMLLRRRCIQR